MADPRDFRSWRGAYNQPSSLDWPWETTFRNVRLVLFARDRFEANWQCLSFAFCPLLVGSLVRRCSEVFCDLRPTGFSNIAHICLFGPIFACCARLRLEGLEFCYGDTLFGLGTPVSRSDLVAPSVYQYSLNPGVSARGKAISHSFK